MSRLRQNHPLRLNSSTIPVGIKTQVVTIAYMSASEP